MVKSTKFNMKKMLKKTNLSLIMLYTVFVLCIFFLGHLLFINDDESLFIFITTAFVIHLSGGNMLYVLLIPLVFVSLLRMMKNNYQKKEGFSLMENEQSNINERIFLVNWIQQNIQDFSEYEQFEESLDESKKIRPLSKLIKSILELNIEALDVEEMDDSVEKFLKYVEHISSMDETEIEDNKAEVKYLEKVYAQISADYLNRKATSQYEIIEKFNKEDKEDDEKKE